MQYLRQISCRLISCVIFDLFLLCFFSSGGLVDMFWLIFLNVSKYVVIIFRLIWVIFHVILSLSSFKTDFSSKILISFHFPSELIRFLKEQKLWFSFQLGRLSLFLRLLRFGPRKMHIFSILAIKLFLQFLSIHFLIRLQKHRHHLNFFIFHRHKQIFQLCNFIWCWAFVEKILIVFLFHVIAKRIDRFKILTIAHCTAIYFLGQCFSFFL